MGKKIVHFFVEGTRMMQDNNFKTGPNDAIPATLLKHKILILMNMISRFYANLWISCSSSTAAIKAKEKEM